MLRVSFRLRQSRRIPKDQLHVIEGYIRLNGVRSSSFSTGIRIYPKEFAKLNELVLMGNEQFVEIQRSLSKIQTGIRQLLNDLIEADSDADPTAHELYAIWTAKMSRRTVLEAYKRFLAVKNEEMIQYRISLDTYRTWVNRYENFKKWVVRVLKEENDIPLGKFSEVLVRSYQKYCTTVLKFKGSHTYRQLVSLKAVFDYSVYEGWIKSSPFDRIDLDKPADPPIQFLSQKQLAKLLKLDVQHYETSVIIDRFIIQCFTGLSQIDLDKFDPDQHLKTDPDGMTWIILRRQKTKNTTKTPIYCRIPVLPQARQRLEKYNWRVPVVSNQLMNKTLKVVAGFIGYMDANGGLSTKVGRSTAGTYLLNARVPIEIVSEILGHSDIRMTKRHYAFLLTDSIRREISHLM